MEFVPYGSVGVKTTFFFILFFEGKKNHKIATVFFNNSGISLVELIKLGISIELQLIDFNWNFYCTSVN